MPLAVRVTMLSGSQCEVTPDSKHGCAVARCPWRCVLAYGEPGEMTGQLDGPLTRCCQVPLVLDRPQTRLCQSPSEGQPYHLLLCLVLPCFVPSSVEMRQCVSKSGSVSVSQKA